MQEYEYYYAGTEFYCYPDTKVLVNKFGIKDNLILSDVERKITALKALELKENPIDGIFDLNHLCNIHKFIFSEIYEWAGKIRGGDYMFKGDTMFCRAIFIEQSFDEYYKKLKEETFLQELEKAVFCERLAYHMGELNAIHPYRDGNGRTCRLYFSQLAENAGFDLIFSNVKEDELLKADIAEFKREYEPLIDVLKKVVQ